MAMIYAYANRVIVWLGEEADGSNLAMEDIRVMANRRRIGIKLPANNMVDGKNEVIGTDNVRREAEAALANGHLIALLRRSWFRRLWVLQEIAAARSISIICGPEEVSGTCFCFALQPIVGIAIYRDGHVLQSNLSSVINLMSDPPFPNLHWHGIDRSFNLGIRPLSQLIDMFRLRTATDRRDKIFALLGMSTLDQNLAALMPDYEIEWTTIFTRLVGYILGKDVTPSVRYWNEKPIGVLSGAGVVFGYVSGEPYFVGGVQEVEVATRDLTWGSHVDCSQDSLGNDSKFIWKLHPSAQRVRKGDVLCALRGATKPSIIRVDTDHFIIIAIAADIPIGVSVRESSLEDYDVAPETQMHSTDWFDSLQKLISARELLLIWAWDSNFDEDTDHAPEKEPASFYAYDKCNQYSLLLEMAQILESVENRPGILDVIQRVENASRNSNNIPQDITAQLGNLRLITAKWRPYLLLRIILAALGNNAFPPQATENPETVFNGALRNVEDIILVLKNNESLKIKLLHTLFREKLRLDGRAISREVKIGWNDLNEVLGLVLQLCGPYFSAHSIMTVENLERPWYQTRQQVLLHSALGGNEHRFIWEKSLIRELFNHAARKARYEVQHKMYEENRIRQLYDLLESVIAEDSTTKKRSWKSPVVEAALVSDPTATVKSLTESQLGEYAISRRPFDTILDFLCSQFSYDEGDLWLKKRALRLEGLSYWEVAHMLFNASRNGSLAELEGILQSEKVDPDEKVSVRGPGDTRLFLTAFEGAMMEGHIECCEILLQHGFQLPPDSYKELVGMIKGQPHCLQRNTGFRGFDSWDMSEKCVEMIDKICDLMEEWKRKNDAE